MAFKKDIKNYIIRVVLTNYYGSRVIDMENADGVIEPHVCIPMDSNNLKKSPRGSVSSYLFMNESDIPSQYGWTHYLRMKCATAFIKKMDSLGYSNPYMGNAKAHNFIIFKNKYKESFVKAKDYE